MKLKSQSENPTLESDKKRFVVAIGFSAGGLDALNLFFENTAQDIPATFIVAEHFPSTSESRLPEILAAHTALPAEIAKDGTPLEIGKILVLPAGKFFTVSDNRLVETHPHAPNHAPVNLIDNLFKSLACDMGENTIGIILSGSGSDGARGVRAIKEEGGFVLVQEPATAPFPSMPEAAIMTGAADFVMTPAEMGKQVANVVRHSLEAPPPNPTSADEEMLSAMRKLTSFLKRHTGLDLGAYKQQSVVRRIERRMSICQIGDFEQYVSYLRKNPKECDLLAKDMLISVTRFFRDTEAFEKLKETILPRIVNESRGRPIRCWVPGCATGEEVYSIGILLEEALQEAGIVDQAVKIFATDLDRKALDIAGQGIYPSSIADEIPAPLLDKYFNRQGEHYEISRTIRERIIFAKHNVLKDPPFTRMDLVSCRNLLIYLQPAAQQCVLSILHFALRPGGVLMLGMSEALGELTEGFTPLDNKQHIFVKKGDSPLFLPETMQFSNISPGFGAHGPHQPPLVPIQERSPSRISEAFTNRILSRLDRTCFVLNSRFEILYSFGNPEIYTRLNEGRSSLNLVDLVDREIGVPLSTAMSKVLQTGEPIHYSPITLSDKRTMGLMVESFQPEPNELQYLLVYFEEGQHTHNVESTVFDLRKSMQRISDLEQELRLNKARLKELIEELEASNEELQTSNEELQAANEELQSTNEELESVNEELQTVNNECENKIAELTKTNDDMDNFISSAAIATIFLDSDLRIRRFTPTAATKTGLLSHDVGREITALSHPLLILAANAAREIIAGSKQLETILPHESGSLMLMRATPFIRKDGQHSGATVSFICIGPTPIAPGSLA